MSGLNPKVMRAPHLPDEILLQLLGYLPNISTLYEITQSVNERILETPYWRCLRPFFTRHPLQIQRLIRFVMCVRYGHVSEAKNLTTHLYWNLEKQHPPPPATFSKWKQFQFNLTNKLPDTLAKHELVSTIPPFLIVDSVHDPIVMMKDMRMVSDVLEYLVHSFINDRLRKTHAKFRDALVQEYQERFDHCNGGGHSKAMHEKHWGPNYCLLLDATDAPATDILPLPNISVEPAHPSPTELHRVRRAFWRLLLYSDFFHEPNPKYTVPQNGAKDATYAFIKLLTVWELEEMGCAYRHLEAQANECADPDSPSYSLDLANRLRATFGLPSKPPECPESKEHPRRNRHITDFLHYYRDMARSVAATNWPDTQEANKPNAGWQYLQQHTENSQLSYQLSSRTEPLRCFLDWGYCIWDASRLDSWWLIDRKGNKFLAGKGKWEWWCSEKCKRGVCGFCDRSRDDLDDSGECGCDSVERRGLQRRRW